MNSKCIKDIDVRAKTIKHLEENTGDNIYDFQFDNGFFYRVEQK